MMANRLLLLGLVACSSTAYDERAAALEPDPRFEIRIAETRLGANGHTKSEVLVVGTKADGTSSAERVILGIDRASAGAFVKSALELGPFGATTHFKPCDQSAAGCLGPAKLTVALASDPGTIVATAAIELVAPTHVSTTTPCLGGGTVMYLDGQNGDFIRNGMLRVVDWASVFTEVDANQQFVRLELTPRKLTQGNAWSMWIDSFELGAPLAPGIYEGAVKANSMTVGAPGLRVDGNSRGCNTLTGRFEIHELDVGATNVLNKVVVSFEQHCEGDTTKLLEGCFRYEKP